LGKVGTVADRRRVPAGIAMAAMLVGMVSYDIAYLFVVLGSTGLLCLQHRLNVALTASVRRSLWW
jgi:hypothetical protein